MVVQVQEQAFELKISSCDFSCDSSKICLKTVIFLFVSIQSNKSGVPAPVLLSFTFSYLSMFSLFCFSPWAPLPWRPPSTRTMASMTMDPASLTTLTMEDLVSVIIISHLSKVLQLMFCTFHQTITKISPASLSSAPPPPAPVVPRHRPVHHHKKHRPRPRPVVHRAPPPPPALVRLIEHHGVTDDRDTNSMVP